MITASIVLDSVCGEYRLTTLRLRYPRFIHAEELTHRILSTEPEQVYQTIPDGVMYDHNLSRNASSSRAIPVHKSIELATIDPVIPMHWGKNQPGMQADEENTALVDGKLPVDAWIEARDDAIKHAKAFADAGYHKQIVNRLLEPFLNITVLVTATEWDNFFELRDHPAAQPEIRILAQAMKKAMWESTPKKLENGEWHLPFVSNFERDTLSLPTLCKISVARAARVSYFTFGGEVPTVDQDLILYDRLVGARPLHASPAEHVAKADPWRFSPDYHRNFKGWAQYRGFIEDSMGNSK